MGSLHSLFLKPSLKCTANCIHCRRRKEFYHSRGDSRLTLSDFIEVIEEAGSLGATSLHLSGGEPTLYNDLPQLIEAGRKLSMFVVLNTNGSLINREYAENLLAAGLNSVIISIHSGDKERHEKIRGRKGNYEEVLNSIKIFRELRDTVYPNFLISTQTIITKSNFLDLPSIIDLVCELQVDAHGISYLEGDFQCENTLNIEQIEILRSTVIPKVLHRLKEHKFRNIALRFAAVNLMKRLYKGDAERIKDFSQGIYIRKNGSLNCRTPKGFALVLNDGSVLPCNMTEYTDGPILGNIKERSLKEIVTSTEWKNFLKTGYKYCKNCPTHLHFHIPISTTIIKILPLIFNNPAYEQKSLKDRISEAM